MDLIIMEVSLKSKASGIYFTTAIQMAQISAGKAVQNRLTSGKMDRLYSRR
jgi:hypothetical protein